jgi:hypothetical protein
MSERTEVLKPQDVVVVCQLAVWGDDPWKYTELSEKLHISRSEIFEALGRCKRAKLVSKADPNCEVNKPHLFDFLVHGVPTAFFPKRIAVVRGVATATHNALFKSRFTTERDIPIVWPYTKGKDVGEGLIPLYPSVPLIALQDPTLYNLFAAIDVLRVGKQREKDAAESLLATLLGQEVVPLARGTI